MVLGTKAVGDSGIAFNEEEVEDLVHHGVVVACCQPRGRRVVHRIQMLVGESAEYSLLLFLEEARRGFMSVRGEQKTVR